MYLSRTRLVSLSDAHLHWATGVLDGGHRRSARAAVMPADLDDIGIGLGHAAGHGADACLGHQLHGHLGLRRHLRHSAAAQHDDQVSEQGMQTISQLQRQASGNDREQRDKSICQACREMVMAAHLVQVKDELRQVLNGVDVVVRGRGDEGHAWLAAPQIGDVGADLLAWQLATLACRSMISSALQDHQLYTARACFCKKKRHLRPKMRKPRHCSSIKHLPLRHSLVSLLMAAAHQLSSSRSLADEGRGPAWLGALGDLDLQLVGVYHELGRDAEAARSHLLDAGGGSVALLQPLQVGEGGGVALLVHIPQMLPPDRVLTPLAGVALACTYAQIIS